MTDKDPDVATMDTTPVDTWVGVPLGGGQMKDPVAPNDELLRASDLFGSSEDADFNAQRLELIRSDRRKPPVVSCCRDSVVTDVTPQSLDRRRNKIGISIDELHDLLHGHEAVRIGASIVVSR